MPAGRSSRPATLSQPFAAERPVGTALYFMVTPRRRRSACTRIRNDQLYHYYKGDPLELVLMKVDGSSEKVVIGPDIAAGQHVQFFIPATPSTPRGSPAGVAGSWAAAPNGRASCRPMSSWATPKHWRRNIPPSRPRSGAIRPATTAQLSKVVCPSLMCWTNSDSEQVAATLGSFRIAGLKPLSSSMRFIR
jgi:hypothetical protein